MAFRPAMRKVEGGGLTFLTDDPMLIAAVRRCAELEAELRHARQQEVARFRTLRREVRQIRRAVCPPAPKTHGGSSDGPDE